MWKRMTLLMLLALTACGSEIDTNCPYSGVHVVYGSDVPEPDSITNRLVEFLAEVGLNIVVTAEMEGWSNLQDVEWKQRGEASTVYVGRDADAADWWTGLYVGGGVSLLDWAGRPDTYLRALTILHELGHSAGATHNDVVGDVMRVGRVWFIPEDEQKMRECFE